MIGVKRNLGINNNSAKHKRSFVFELWCSKWKHIEKSQKNVVYEEREENENHIFLRCILKKIP